MNHKLTEQELTQLEKFLTWFASQEEIPLKTRRDFLAHIIEIGHIDEHSAKFIDKTLHYLEHKSTKNLKQWHKELAMWEKFINAENNEETSLQVRDVKEAEKLINDISDKFVEDFKNAEKESNKINELNEKSREISKVEALKASLN